MSHHSPAFLALVELTRCRVREISAADFAAAWSKRPPWQLIDVRERQEFDAGHPCGAIWLGKGIIERDIEALFPERETPLYLYCGGGYRSVLAADNLQRMGYAQVCSINGGWRELQCLLPLE